MKRLLIFLTLCAIILVFAITGVYAAQRTLRINKVCPTVPGLTMTNVTITNDRTLVDFEWKNMDGDYSISIYAPTDDGAFSIKDRRTAKIYRLRSAQGIAFYPNSVKIREGEKTQFTLVFDKMPSQYVSLIQDAAALIVSAEYK